jgi:gamma-glutamylcyclotransferase (GGCT)/AIG2-like uncharacterized protein YtfP
MTKATHGLRRVFVYGTLRLGWGLNRYIKDYGGKFIDTVTISGYKMYSLGGYPGINKTDNEKDIVVGEVYEFPEENVEGAMRVLDSIELGAGYKRGIESILGVDTYLYIHKTNFAEGEFYKDRVMVDWTKEARGHGRR